MNIKLNNPQVLSFHYLARGTISTDTDSYVPTHRSGEYFILLEFNGSVVQGTHTGGGTEAVGLCNCKIDMYGTKRYNYYAIATNEPTTVATLETVIDSVTDDVHNADYAGGAVTTS